MGSVTETVDTVSPWLSLGEASRMLGITPATLRRWADHGDVAAFVTPGGHRRFARSAINAMIPPPSAARPQLAGLAGSANRVARTYQRSKPAAHDAAPGRTLAEADRADFKERGHRLLMLLIDHLGDDTRPRPPTRLQEAVGAASEYGARAAALGATQAEAVEAFVRFRGAFTGELAALARRRRLGTRDATALLVEADGAVDRLLVALMNGHARGAR